MGSGILEKKLNFLQGKKMMLLNRADKNIKSREHAIIFRVSNAKVETTIEVHSICQIALQKFKTATRTTYVSLYDTM